jgi:tRNA A37 threonylcarbamoyladenosine biosynthesis protein TsaE
MELTSQQNTALEYIKAFVQDKDKSVFILMGYAGTGKTTMIKALIPEIQKIGKKVKLMAPTGRAAKVLKEKTGYSACTIHLGIYSFEKMQVVRHDDLGNLIKTDQTSNTELRSKGSDDLQFWFGLKQQEPDDDPSKNVYIVDEASMISSRRALNEMLHFGTDILIDDLLTYVQPHLGGKIIFVGDPAQLPPVGDNRSVALDEKYFTEKGFGCAWYELNQVMRQGDGSLILKNAMMIRDLLQSQTRNQLCFERKCGEVEDITQEQVVDSFIENNPNPAIGESVVLCYSNALVKEYNDAIRARYYPNTSHIVPGDIVQIVRNTVNNALRIGFFNGDFAKVLEVSENVEIQSAPVWTDVAGNRERVTISLEFRDVVLQTIDGILTKCKIVDTLLNSREPSLSPLQSVALYINFRMRHPQLRPNEEAFKDALKHDPYFNAVQAKYGYAITGHKSQGGEWEKAYIDFSGRTGLNNDCLRWSYTATTRAERILYGVNMPDITPMSKLKFNPVAKYSKPAKEAFSYADVFDIEYLPNSAAAFQKQKCICVKQSLDDKGYYLKSITPCQYNDKYTIETPSGTVVIDCYYNGSGQYTRYCPESTLPENDELLCILESANNFTFAVDYHPSEEVFRLLFSKVKSVCDDNDIVITNVVEHTQQYYVSYYLKTSGKFAQILFYFNSNHVLSHALPSSDLGSDDTKLVILINSFV